MNDLLDNEFQSWIGRMAIEWAIPISDVPKYLGQGGDNIPNRLRYYPILGESLTRQPIDLQEVENAGVKCLALSEQFDKIRFRKFTSYEESKTAISDLIMNFPSSDDEVKARIDRFIEYCLAHGYSDPSKENKTHRSSAGLLASTLLTSAFPQRFVDFRQERWKEFAKEFEHELLAGESPTYGDMVVEAGQFAQSISQTKSFKKLWPGDNALWKIAGICWSVSSDRGAQRPAEAPIFPYEEDFDEGSMTLRPHLIRERSFGVVKKAKEHWKSNDPLLRCDVCSFSFVERYGDHADGYIEAHHTKPLGSLKAGTKTRIKDLAKVCANCHRMLHRKNACHTLDELRAMLKSNGSHSNSVLVCGGKDYSPADVSD